MSRLLSTTILQRDGTGQAQRQVHALNPEFIPIEERSLEDWIAFAKQYAKELRFFNENNQPSGTWEAFLADTDVAELLRYVDNPETFSGEDEKIRKLSRPHLVLFISFLQLLGFIKDQLNGFTKKHLDFYYFEILGLTKKGPVPDEANVIIQLADDVKVLFIQKGTQLFAGQDSDGKELIYVTERDTLINQAQVKKIKTLYTGKTTTTLRQVDESNKDIRLIRMLQLALGTPRSGDPLPPYNNTSVTLDTLKDIRTNTAANESYITKNLFLSTDEFTYIIDNYNTAAANWEQIAYYLKKAYSKRAAAQNANQLNEPAPDSIGILMEPVQVDWTNAYGINDAVANAFTSDSSDETLYFNTFGKGHSDKERAAAQSASIGFAVSSPQLLLKEGVRNITLILSFNDTIYKNFIPKNAATGEQLFPFSVFISTSKGWLLLKANEQYNIRYVNGIGNENDTYDLIQVDIRLAETDAAVVAPDAPGDVMTIQSINPVVGLVIHQNENAGITKSNYQLFKDLQLQNIEVVITATKLKTLTLQNDDAVLNYKKPFEPFGFTPETGSHFYFAHPEICSKPLSTLTLHFEWMNTPTDFSTYYAGYDIGINNASFNAGLKCIDENIETDINNNLSLFDSTDATKAHAATTTVSKLPIQSITEEAEVLNWKRYFSLELGAPDFRHNIYPELVTRKAYNNSLAISAASNQTDAGSSNQPGIDLTPLNPPYTPKLKSFTVDYTTSFTIDINANTTIGENSLFHINAFGYSTPVVQTTKSNDKETNWMYFLPQFENEGELYIGITSLAVPQNLALFFQLAEGSADPDLEKPPVAWSYLSNNNWIALEGTDLVFDSTNGLLNTGIIELAIPADASCNNTLLGENLYWLRAGVTANADAIPDTVAILTQGINAVFTDNDNAPEHYAQLLQPESIKDTVTPTREIKKISQPYSSTKGKPAEENKQFYIRVSERLRHKSRALTMWDYEHLVLDQFPEIYKVKCVPGEAIGAVDIIVIPDIKGKLPFNPFQPKAPANVIYNIQQYLQNRIAAWAAISVKNPSYIQVKVRIAVKIKEGYSENFFAAKLEEELIQYLAPWAYDNGADIYLDTRLDADVIINFVAERFYVEYASDIYLFTSINGKDFTKANPVNGEYFVQAINPGDILVSAGEHVIDLIRKEYKQNNYQGIGYMQIGLDFQIR